MSTLINEIEKQLPGFNCRACGNAKCKEFAAALAAGGDIAKCPYLKQPHYKLKYTNIKKLLQKKNELEKEAGVTDNIDNYKTGTDVCDNIGKYETGTCIRGVIDKYKADFFLEPLDGEPSCREIIFPFSRDPLPPAGSFIKYRPLGCPVPHFAKVIGNSKGLLTIHLVGPCRIKADCQAGPCRVKPDSDESKFPDIGVCMIGGFIGLVKGGDTPAVGATVRFIPGGCMMRKVHSGVIVQAEGDKLYIEGIDLKVWALPEAFPGI